MLFKLRWTEVLGYLAVLLAPIYPAMIALTWVLAIDWVTGVWASRRRGERITSKRMSETITKVVLYNLLIITAIVVETYLAPGFPLVRLAIGFIGMVELKSVAENITALTGVDFWKALLKYFKRKGIDAMDGAQKDIKSETTDEDSTETK